MKLRVSEEIIDKYPQLRIGYVVASDVYNWGSSEKLAALKKEAAKTVSARFVSHAISEHPHIQAWQAVYQAFGCSPRKHRPTAESLLRRLAAGQAFPEINTLVDAYLIAETEMLLPVGGYDLDHVVGDVVLRVSPGGESFLPLGADREQTTQPGEVVYSDAEGVLTRRWNYRDSDRTKITESTTRVALFSEAPVPEIPTSAVEAVIQRIATLIRDLCAGHAETGVAYVTDAPELSILPIDSKWGSRHTDRSRPDLAD